MAQRHDNQQRSTTPSHLVFQVRETNGNGEQNSTWTEIGAMWPHKDGHGFTVQLNLVPLDGRLTIRTLESVRSRR